MIPLHHTLFSHLPERLAGLAENLWWSWRSRARKRFKMLDRQAWTDSGHNPDRMLRDLPAEVLAAAAPGHAASCCPRPVGPRV